MKFLSCFDLHETCSSNFGHGISNSIKVGFDPFTILAFKLYCFVKYTNNCISYVNGQA